jgi:2-dehydro-3-deoxyphosphogluconate aldolase/(4S)-4-hydroxy-2-oxoglutarate aldolase
VRSLEDLEKAISVGAQFIVTPITSVEVIEECVRNHVPVIPGALTPTEIQLAYELGASFVKVFPVNAMGGPSYIKDLRGPFKDIPLMACGGVNESNASEYRAAGANLLAFGASIFDPEQMRSHQWEAIEKKLKAFLSSI